MEQRPKVIQFTGEHKREYQKFLRDERVKDFKYFFSPDSAKGHPERNLERPFTKAQYAIALYARDRDDIMTHVVEALAEEGAIPDLARQDAEEAVEDFRWFESQGWLKRMGDDSYELTSEGRNVLSGATSASLN